MNDTLACRDLDALSGTPVPAASCGAHVLYIAGLGRSGSTLLCRTLGAVEGFVATGELMRILGRGVITRDLCSCGVAVVQCPFWTPILEDLFRRRPDLDLERVERTRRRITEEWEVFRYLFVPRRNPVFARELDELRGFARDLYESIHRVTGARVIVDASKSFMYARLLTATPGLRMSVLHLVRDSRGVAHSLARKTPRPGTTGREEYFRQHGPVVGSAYWTAANVATELLGWWVPLVLRVRYEDFIANPSATVTSIVRRLAPIVGSPPLPHVNGRSVCLDVDHLIASNPNRSKRGEIELREDVAWQREMGRLRRWVVTGLTLPLLRRYGYPARPVRLQLASRATAAPSVPPGVDSDRGR